MHFPIALCLSYRLLLCLIITVPLWLWFGKCKMKKKRRRRWHNNIMIIMMRMENVFFSLLKFKSFSFRFHYRYHILGVCCTHTHHRNYSEEEKNEKIALKFIVILKFNVFFLWKSIKFWNFFPIPISILYFCCYCCNCHFLLGRFWILFCFVVVIVVSRIE